VLLADGAGGVSPPAFFNTGNRDSSPHGLAASKVNYDAIPDLTAVYGYEGGSVYSFLGDGLGLFIIAGSTYFTQHEAWGLAVADLNRDRLDDVVTIAQRSGGYSGTQEVPPGPPRIYIMLSHSSDGVFFEPTSFLAGRVPGAVIAADLNGDRKLDLATTDVETKSLSVRMNGILPRLTGVWPAQGHVGDVVTLTGRWFGHRGIVQFGGKTVTDYLSWDHFKIKVRVPKGTARGSVKVTVTTIIGRSAPRAFVRLQISGVLRG
jgi:hypothetical protein